MFNLNKIALSYPDFNFELILRVSKQNKYCEVSLNSELYLSDKEFKERILDPVFHNINSKLK